MVMVLTLVGCTVIGAIFVLKEIAAFDYETYVDVTSTNECPASLRMKTNNQPHTRTHGLCSVIVINLQKIEDDNHSLHP